MDLVRKEVKIPRVHQGAVELGHDIVAAHDDDFKSEVRGRVIDVEECVRYLQMTEAGRAGAGWGYP